MGKWAFLNKDGMLPGIEEKLRELIDLDPLADDLTIRWRAAGSPMLEDYGLRWYSGSSGGGWATIDDEHGRKRFMISTGYKGRSGHQQWVPYWEMVATVICYELGYPRLTLLDSVIPEKATDEQAVNPNFYKTHQPMQFTTVGFEGRRQSTFRALCDFDLFAEALELMASLEDMKPPVKKVEFTNCFLNHLVAGGFIEKVEPIRSYELVREIENDAVNRAFLESWLK